MGCIVYSSNAAAANPKSAPISQDVPTCITVIRKELLDFELADIEILGSCPPDLTQIEIQV